MKLPAYPRTKPSGVEWLGDVPEHWAAQGVKFCYSIQLGKMLQPEPASPTDEETPYLKSQHVQWEHVRVADLPTMWTNKKERRQYAVKDGDLLVCEGGDVGRAAVVRGAPDDTIIQNALHRVRPQGENETGFLLYVLAHAASQGWFEIICNKSTIAHFTVDKFGALGVALPTPAEQRSIAAFLDRETGRVDRLVAKKRELIERLKEKRTALISRTVTRGLPPAAARAAGLPAHPPLKPSALDWLGDIPAHWEVKKLGYGAYLQGGYAFASEKFDSEGVPVVRMNNLKRGVLDTSDASCVAPENCLDDFALAEGDLLWGMSGSIGETGSLGNFARVRACDLPAQLNQRVGRFRVIGESIALGFLTYVIQTKFFYDQILLRVTGTAQFNVSSEQVQSAKVPYPPLPEQAAIAAYLDLETAKLDALVGKVEEAVERLQEYRTALITAAVTGKIDVRKESNGQ